MTNQILHDNNVKFDYLIIIKGLSRNRVGFDFVTALQSPLPFWISTNSALDRLSIHHRILQITIWEEAQVSGMLTLMYSTKHTLNS
jgi:hypothetical protein